MTEGRTDGRKHCAHSEDDTQASANFGNGITGSSRRRVVVHRPILRLMAGQPDTLGTARDVPRCRRCVVKLSSANVVVMKPPHR